MSAQNYVGTEDAAVSLIDEAHITLDDHYRFARGSVDASVRQAFCERAVSAHGSGDLYEKVRYHTTVNRNGGGVMMTEITLSSLIRRKLFGTAITNHLKVYPRAFEITDTIYDFMYILNHEGIHAKEQREQRDPEAYGEYRTKLSQLEGAFFHLDVSHLDAFNTKGVHQHVIMRDHLEVWRESMDECNAYLGQQSRSNNKIRPELRLLSALQYLSHLMVVQYYEAIFAENPVLNGMLGVTHDRSANEYLKRGEIEIHSIICSLEAQYPGLLQKMLQDNVEREHDGGGSLK
ncbi:TPA: hypothetical protein HA251_04605 [Candidatus Woesearchaeota archaeon]|nr:hypothetical protein [Candidatus Woesearchaeota archaeon]